MKQTDLILQFNQDREAAFRKIYQLAFPRVASLIAQRGGSLEEAKDVFHEGMIILYEKCMAGQLQVEGSVISYLAGICRNLWLNGLAGAVREFASGDLSAWEELPEETPSDTAQGFSLLNLLEKAGKKCLDMLQAVYYFKYSMQEVAEEFGFRSTRSATVQKYKCLEKVRNEVKKHQDEGIPA